MESNKSQHNDEIELLQSIYADSMKMHAHDPYHSFEIEIIPDSNEKPALCIIFEVEFVESYPTDKLFNYKVWDKNNRAIASQFTNLHTKVSELFEENKGFPVVYQVAELIKEYSNELDTKLQDHSNKKQVQAIIEESEQIKEVIKIASVPKKEALLETRKFTPVSKETYEEWFKKFMEFKIKEGGKDYKLRKEIMSRASGREYFMNSKNKEFANNELDIGGNEEEDEDDEYIPDNKEADIDADVFQDEDDVDIDEIDFDDEEEYN